MLNSIKSLIAEKMEFQESADLILENDELDDEIILADDSEESDIDKSKNNNDTSDEDHEDEDIEDSEKSYGKSGYDEDDNDDDDEDEDDDDDEDNSALSDDKNWMRKPYDVPESPSAPGSEPSNATNDILSMEIDMGSNTFRDTLPYPPDNAVDAVNDDNMMNQRIDTGFGKDSEKKNTGLFDEPINGRRTGQDSELADDIMTEAIKVDDEDEQAPDADNSSDNKTDENPVTQAVKDKVAETNPEETPADTTEDSEQEAPTDQPENTDEMPPIEDPVEPNTTITNDGGIDKHDLFKKLTSLTNGIEEVKKQLVNSMK